MTVVLYTHQFYLIIEQSAHVALCRFPLMIIDLRTINQYPRHFDLVFKPDWWQRDEENGPIVGLNGSLECRIAIARAGVRYILDGSLTTILILCCDRCLETYQHKLDFQFRLFLSALLPDSDQSELELAEDDMWTQFIEGNEVDLNDIVREQIYLSLPMKSLCREECRGLCPMCGVNLNKERCECQSVGGIQVFRS